MIALPPSHPVCLRGFSILIGAFGALLIGACLFLSGIQSPLGLGAASGFVLSLPGLLRPKLLSWPYRAWNKLAVEFARWASLLVMTVLFYVVFVAVGRSGSALGLDRPASNESLWKPRRTLAPDAYKAQYPQPSRASSEDGFIFPFFSWATQTGNLWARFLLPYILLLSALGSVEEQELPTDIYTLF